MKTHKARAQERLNWLNESGWPYCGGFEVRDRQYVASKEQSVEKGASHGTQHIHPCVRYCKIGRSFGSS